jgi:hypothetical protein
MRFHKYAVEIRAFGEHRFGSVSIWRTVRGRYIKL